MAAGTAVVISGSEYASCELSGQIWTCSDGADNYGPNEQATIRLHGPGAVDFLFVRTFGVSERNYVDNSQCSIFDRLQVGEHVYCSIDLELMGTSNPNILPRRVEAGATLDIQWHSDSDQWVAEGFEFTFTPDDNPSCPLGQARPSSGSNCTSCAPGKHRGNLSSSSCTFCDRGRYQGAVRWHFPIVQSCQSRLETHPDD